MIRLDLSKMTFKERKKLLGHMNFELTRQKLSPAQIGRKLNLPELIKNIFDV